MIPIGAKWPLEELVSRAAYRTVSREFVRAVAAAQVTLRAAGREDEAVRLGWSNVARAPAYLRFPSRGRWGRLADGPGAGPGWKTLSMVQRYAHLSPDHLAAAVEKIVAVPAVVAPEAVSGREHRQDFDSAESASREAGVRH